MVRLNLGSGERHLPGYLSVDFNDSLQGIGLVHDLRKPLPYHDNSVEAIFTSHLIEHIWWEDVQVTLRDWYRVIQHGGFLDVWTVDFGVCVELYNSGIEDPIDKMNQIARLTHNHKVYAGAEHQSIFSRDQLCELLKRADFSRMKLLNADLDFPFPGVHIGFNMGVRAWK